MNKTSVPPRASLAHSTSNGTGTHPDPAIDAFKALIKPFFPTWSGCGIPQARPYIRTSALGRGSLPTGSLSAAASLQLLERWGFSNGGRQGHLYAPWSPINPKRAKEASEFRSDLARFMGQGVANGYAKGLLEDVRRLGARSGK